MDKRAVSLPLQSPILEKILHRTTESKDLLSYMQILFEIYPYLKFGSNMVSIENGEDIISILLSVLYQVVLSIVYILFDNKLGQVLIRTTNLDFSCLFVLPFQASFSLLHMYINYVFFFSCS